MDAINRFFDWLREVFGMAPRNQSLSPFQVAKLQHEFSTFYDMNGDGKLQWKDFEMARDYICEKSGWKPKSAKWNACRQLFADLWRNLLDTADKNIDGEVTAEEWLQLWGRILNDKREYERSLKGKLQTRTETSEAKKHDDTGADDDNLRNNEHAGGFGFSDDKRESGEVFLPLWFENYIEYKFSLLDRAGDGVLDEEEFEYTLSDAFNISPKECQTAFRMMTKNNEVTIDRKYFRTLALQFYLSNDPGDLGNFINGKLVYD
jgi:Ca2+-binding EF-hand superfamily protein